MENKKIFIYQILPRLFGNTVSNNIKNGSIVENGCGKFADISSDLLNKLKDDGYTHIWLIGVLAHASTTEYIEYGLPREFPEIIKGRAGSPYAVRDYYDVDPDLAVNVDKRMDEFEATIERIHKAGMKVIIDFIPNHLARNYRSINKPDHIEDFGDEDDQGVWFSNRNNFYYMPGEELNLDFVKSKYPNAKYEEIPAKATGNDSFTSHPSIYDWYETVKLNYGIDYLGGGARHFWPIPDTWHKMKDILLYWADKNIDGFRCDMAEMVPVEFWEWVVPQVKEDYPGIVFIAEIYNPSLYRSYLGDNIFDYLYDKVGLYDVLRDVAAGHKPSSDISFALNAVGDIQHKMLNFIENHDEQRVASDFFLSDANAGKPLMIVSACVNTNPVMVYFGQELGEPGMDEEGFSGRDGRTTIFDYWSVDSVRRWNNEGKWNDDLLTDGEKGLKLFYSRLVSLCNKEKALSHGLFYDLMFANYENMGFDSTKQFAFLRGYKDDLVLVVANFDNKPVEIVVEIPEHAFQFFNYAEKSKFVAKPLLEADVSEIAFTNSEHIKIKLEQNSGEIYKVLAL